MDAASAVATKVRLAAGAGEAFADWQSALVRAASEAPGFASLELIATYAGSAEWQIVQRFDTAEALRRWQATEERARLLETLGHLAEPGGQALVDEAAPDFHAASFVTEIVTTTVDPGKEAAFRAWAEAMQAQQARFPGYMGTLVQAPVPARRPSWTTLVRFAMPEQLDAWLASEERARLLASADPAMSTWKSRRMDNAFAGWFPETEDRASPPAWKQTALVLLVLFPVVMLEIRFLSPHLAGLNLAVATFIGNAISVSLVSWPLMAIAIRCLNWWLRPAPARRRRVELLGAATMAALYGLEILAFTLLW
ncbi:MAG: antibiotic biosynthesis monooxygenase [Rhizobiales bacterium]|nr:antibiotic biosynthesis monooxygenase [Hyphomicrobiales bacterium]